MGNVGEGKQKGCRAEKKPSHPRTSLTETTCGCPGKKKQHSYGAIPPQMSPQQRATQELPEPKDTSRPGLTAIRPRWEESCFGFDYRNPT